MAPAAPELTIAANTTWNRSDGWPEVMPKVDHGIVKWEHQPGHRPFSSYSLPKWVKHPDHQRPAMYVQPEDYLCSRKKGNCHGFNIAHVGAQCNSFDGLGIKMLKHATPAELDARDLAQGFTPLHWAVLCDNPKAVIWLLKNGADRDAVDFDGRKAEDMIEDSWGFFEQRYFEWCGPKKDGVVDASKVPQKRIKQLKQAFKGVWEENEYDIPEYKQIQV
eukprot:gnl/TRDRNA2_/TRDRNA2_154179_c0_seq2.p1 gnl/TRDRNA2_/TRDRNA2_154179_c0~~gnl/TRDRNA2_/TRDRNA2_154179_c0_seq2.p1  ORF type:complete len:219 (+),score=62.99 gnl/TRDRNA2_/TRDRNA2_154179_c0_seq2:48-704(+)